MPDNWGFVIAAYGLTAVVLGLYWHHLVRKEKELAAAMTRDSAREGHSRPDPTPRQPRS